MYEHFEDLSRPPDPCVVTIGSFDGLHRGHQLLFERVQEKAKTSGWKKAAFTFHPHPARVLAPRYSPPLLMSHERKIRALGSLGLDFTLAQHFDARFASLSAEDFAGRVLAERLGVRQVVVGDDFTFGRDRRGMPEDLATWGRKYGFGVEVVRRLCVEGMLVSSTRVRSFLLQGKVRGAAVLLGRPYVVQGKVVSGQGRGRRLGIPTANLSTSAELLPARGVYACLFWVEGLTQGLVAVTNVGIHPTFEPTELGVEVHAIDRDLDLMGKRVAVGFLERLREERAYPTAEKLVAQIHDDIERARDLGGRTDTPTSLSLLDGIQLDIRAP